jgi:integrase
MAKGIDKLTALAVRRESRPGYYGDGGGLWLQISAKYGTKSWVFRFKSPVTGKAREMGMGSIDTYSLAEARVRAKEMRQIIDAGRDPIAEREADRQRTKLAAAMALTFDQCATAYIEAHRPGWKNPKHAAQWESTLATYAGPVVGDLPVAKVDMPLVLKILEPIWTTKNETASRLRGRIESVLDWATVRGYRTGDNPARWKGHLDKLLPAPGKVQKVEHHAALPYEEIGTFMVELRKQEGMGARALEFAILTACRSGEVRGATWDEIDMVNRLWIIPAERMKMKKEHRVPLSDAAVSLLESLPRLKGSEAVFFAPRGGKLSDMTLTAVLRRMKRGEPTVHGFRSTFRDWAGETTAYPREVIEHALAHQLKDKAEAAYQRGDLLVKRARLMQSWAESCAIVQSGATVTPINSASA